MDSQHERPGYVRIVVRQVRAAHEHLDRIGRPALEKTQLTEKIVGIHLAQLSGVETGVFRSLKVLHANPRIDRLGRVEPQAGLQMKVAHGFAIDAARQRDDADKGQGLGIAGAAAKKAPLGHAHLGFALHGSVGSGRW